MSRHPEIVWAQRSDRVFVTVELPDAIDTKCTVTPEGRFSYSAKLENGEHFATDLELFERINVEESKTSVGTRHTFCVLVKESPAWWKRLLKAEGKGPAWLKVDWSKYVDEDEENEAPDFDMGGMGDLSSMLGGGGAGAFDNVEEDEEDEEDDFGKEGEPLEEEKEEEKEDGKEEGKVEAKKEEPMSEAK